ncbi:MAG: hypothetical protein NTV08_19360 [Verrucomicrobia bacterium]|nr:hypothetical protein [Verrucomicrobiota bacterium]
MSTKTTPQWKLYEVENGLLTEDQVFTQVGAMLFTLHQFEKSMKLCAAILQSAAMSKTDDIGERFWGMRKATCGGVATELRKFVEIEEGFDRVLTRLIKRRNAFAHKLSAHTPFKPTAGTAWLRNVPRFIWAMHADLIKVEDVFNAYLQACLDRFEGNPTKNSLGPGPYPLLGFKRPRS